jgi:agmatinase
VEAQADAIFSKGKIPFLLGGEHLASLAPIRAALRKEPDLCVLHFDAHADLRADYLGEPLSHACVMRRVWELLGDARIFQFGIRSGDRPEFDFAKEHTVMEKFGFSTLDAVLARLTGKPLYFSLDLDALDPACFPGTGTPEAGGAGFTELLDAVLKIGKKGNVVGLDMVELSPPCDPGGASTALACKLLREILLSLRRP